MQPNVLLLIAPALWLLALLIGLVGKGKIAARTLLAVGAVTAAAGAITSLPNGSLAADGLPAGLVLASVAFSPDALWLLFFGALVAVFACSLGSPATNWRSWVVGAALSMIGAWGCFGIQNAVGFLVAWEVMSLGGALMLMGERLGPQGEGRHLLFMLALLEVGAVALLAAFLMASHAVGSTDFSEFKSLAANGASSRSLWIGVLLLIGFGAKLGLLPFYEWYPGAYGQGSGASGALLSGIVLNAAFFALERGYTSWLAADETLGIVLIAIGVISAILSVLYAFQEDDWRRLLAFSSAENASIAVTLLGASQLFAHEGQLALASLGYVVALLHLAGHALAKGALMLAADGVYSATGSYALAQTGSIHRGRLIYGLGVVFAGMSLAAMPPQAGFVSEWFTFQTLFQGFRLEGLGARLTLSLAGAGMALTAAIAFATFVKIVGIGVLGRRETSSGHGRISVTLSACCGLLGIGVLVLAVGMPWWLPALDKEVGAQFMGQTSLALHKGLILVPLTDTFAFISPTKLIIACPLLAILPLALLWRSRRLHRVRRAPVWFGGGSPPPHGATTSLTFSNAMRTFYGFVYRPASVVEAEHGATRYVVRNVNHAGRVSPLFEAAVFRAPTRFVQWLAKGLGPLQSGHMNVYLALVGSLLVLILATALF